MSEDFAPRLLAWYDRHGRKDLPWKQSPTSYRIWISEIMLQQTQVSTVIPYYHRFIARFPSVMTLADAELDDALHLWSGLGYYARARNLHKAARKIRDEHDGVFPKTVAALMELPGIGRSTAGAILALAHDQRHPILDGNVKRVLCRFQAVHGWPGETAVLRRLWELSDQYTPTERVADYTQAIMDLGATVCTRSAPRCSDCPHASDCAGHASGNPARYPLPRPRKSLPVRQVTFVLLRDPQGSVLLERRPPTGVWGGLWSLPECPPKAAVADWCLDKLGRQPDHVRLLQPFRHTFSHFHLEITPALVEVQNPWPAVLDGDQTLWYNPAVPGEQGLPAPVTRLLAQLKDHRQES